MTNLFRHNKNTLIDLIQICLEEIFIKNVIIFMRNNTSVNIFKLINSYLVFCSFNDNGFAL